MILKGDSKACKDIKKFVKNVNKLIDKEKLASEKAQPLLDRANELLENCPVKQSDDDEDKDD